MIFYTCIIALCFAIYYNFVNYTDHPKQYIIEKYNQLMIFNYELQIDALMNNTELKKDIKSVLKIIFLFSAYLDFDAFIEKKELFAKKFDELTNSKQLNQIVNHQNITNNYVKYNISQNYYRDIYFNTFNLMNLNKLQLTVNDLFLKNIFETNEKFFKALNKQMLIMNINRDDLLSKKIIDKIYSNVLYDFDFYSGLIQLEPFIEYMDILKKLDTSYYCVKLMNDSCPNFLEPFIKNNDFLNEVNDSKFNYELKYNNKCCNYD
jgi:hypothetical protein